MRRNKPILMLLFLSLSICLSIEGQQKKNVDFDAIDKWTALATSSLSPNGKFASFVINNEPLGYKTLTLKATDGTWDQKIILNNSTSGRVNYTDDSKFCIFHQGDSLVVMMLGKSSINYIPNAGSKFHLLKSSPYLIYETANGPNKIIIHDIASGKQIASINCEMYAISPNEQYLVFSKQQENNAKTYIVSRYDLSTLLKQNIWSGGELDQFTFDRTGNRLAFIDQDKINNRTSIIYYQNSDTFATAVVNNRNIELPDSFTISSLVGFTKEGSMLYFKIRSQRPEEAVQGKMAKVDVWNFNDPILQETQLTRKIKPSNELLTVFHFGDGRLYPLCPSNNKFTFDPSKAFYDKAILYINNGGGGLYESYWNKRGLDTVVLVSADNGERKIIDYGLPFLISETYQISLSGKFILYYDCKTNNYFSYEVKTGARINLTKDIHAEWIYAFKNVLDPQHDFSDVRGVVGWIKETNDVLLQDRFDIWRVSLDGTKKPVCITKGYGGKNNIELSIFPDSRTSKLNSVFNDRQKIYLTGLSGKKENGIFSTYIDSKSPVKKLIMSNYRYAVDRFDVRSCKAEKTNAWIVQRESCTESNNLFFTKDFKRFSAVSNNYPEKQYNWLTSQLMEWYLPDGSISKGILYKPENFDSTKKYPVIFYYYEEMADELNFYLKPERPISTINIPYYVSNGYLVFTPDIKRTSNGAGWDALNTMASAALYLGKLPFVDKGKLGLNGASMGGYKTNFIVTHCNLFAAANSNVGPANVSSFGLSLWGNGGAMGEVEMPQTYIGHSIVERPDLYVTNSPIFYVSQVKTPMLMMYNKRDEANYVEGIALFQALRRAGKPAWLLQYDNGDHGLLDSLDQADWAIRQKQFFDHYLMDKPAPVWMTRGIPAWRKGIDDGFELDTEIKTPVSKLLTDEEKKTQQKAFVLPNDLYNVLKKQNSLH